MRKRLIGAVRLVPPFSATLLAMLGACAGAQPPDTSTVASTIQLECTPAAPSVARLYNLSGLSDGIEVCAGPEDTSLIVVSADEGSWIDVLRPVSTEKAVIYGLRPGNFPTVASKLSGDKTRLTVGWIKNDKGRAIALVFPVKAQVPEGNAQDSELLRFFVVRLPKQEACVLGSVATMADAGALATSSRGCIGDSTEQMER